MNKAVRKYLRQVKKHLYCPASHKREFLRRLENEILLYCETQDKIDFIQLAAHFGAPEDVAADFFAELNAAEVSRSAYVRLKITYLLFAASITMALSIVTVSIIDYVKTQKWFSGVPVMENCTLTNGNEFTCFWVKTNFKGRDVYWEYSSLSGGMYMIPQPEEFDGTEPYASDIYFYKDGVLEHWTFGDDHMFWVRVFDV